MKKEQELVSGLCELCNRNDLDKGSDRILEVVASSELYLYFENLFKVEWQWADILILIILIIKLTLMTNYERKEVNSGFNKIFWNRTIKLFKKTTNFSNKCETRDSKNTYKVKCIWFKC